MNKKQNKTHRWVYVMVFWCTKKSLHTATRDWTDEYLEAEWRCLFSQRRLCYLQIVSTEVHLYWSCFGLKHHQVAGDWIVPVQLLWSIEDAYCSSWKQRNASVRQFQSLNQNPTNEDKNNVNTSFDFWCLFQCMHCLDSGVKECMFVCLIYVEHHFSET